MQIPRSFSPSNDDGGRSEELTLKLAARSRRPTLTDVLSASANSGNIAHANRYSDGLVHAARGLSRRSGVERVGAEALSWRESSREHRRCSIRAPPRQCL